MWVEYFELNARLAEAQQAELDAFAARWSGTYVEDRLRNDWLLELGRRRDWANFRTEYPRFRMNDDREVSCYALLVQHQDGLDVRAAARAAWYAQRDLDDGCQLLGRTLYDARVLGAADVWQEVRLSVEANRPRAARAAAALLDAGLAAAVDAVFKEPGRVLRERRDSETATSEQLAVLALWRLAASDVDAALTHLEQHYATHLASPQVAAAWAGVARQSGLKLDPRAADHVRRAWAAWDRALRSRSVSGSPPWSDETLAWHVRALLRLPAADPQRWPLVARAIDAMGSAEQRDPAWVYWRARAALALAAPGAEGEGARGLARLQLESIASPLTFYGQLAAEDLGQPYRLPAAPAAPAAAELESLAAHPAHPGLQRGLQLIALGLRSEGVREWNFSLRGLGDRELLAAAQLACAREVWDRCINASDRTRTEVDLAQRYPTPFREQVLARAREVGVEAAYVFGLIRQESRFILDARSSVGASGLMQLMPATARWTAQKLGLDWKPELITDRDLNLRLGMTYLRLLKDDFGGSNVMAAAAYNAGPGRPRRWREGGAVEAAAWVEGIPFNETRDYVKKVLANTVVYAALLGQQGVPVAGAPGAAAGALALKTRLGGPIGPRDPGAAPADRDLP
ncbi:MAG: lytic transglycosylase domain-containing protein [Rubrivivax sp.]|nr:lytic transglycosylase domain-containing protein [Rubrivivax sp.]